MINAATRRGGARGIAVAAALSTLCAVTAAAQNREPLGEPALRRLSIEELSRIDVTSASKHAEPVSEAAAAIVVLTHDDLRRSGITTLAEALRLATGVGVARFDGHTWAISARGFNITTANKMAVFIDGRSIYTPLFSGVFWDVQDYVLDDIDRIEVIRGPGGALWGANAVNGVINIITRTAEDTAGGRMSIGGGNDLGQVSARYGGRLGATAAYRAYAKYRYRAGQLLSNGLNANDPLRSGQAGFRTDWQPSTRTAFGLQGDFYKGLVGLTDRADSDVNGGNILARMTHTANSGSQIQVQGYFDRTSRSVPRQLAERRATGDFDLQYRFSAGTRHDLTTGGGFRVSRGRVTPSQVYFFEPDLRTDRLYSAFVEDNVTIVPGVLDITAGAKLEHNDYTGLEYQPTLRGRWSPTTEDTVWAAMSRAVRIPARFDTDLRFTANTPVVVLQGDPAFRSEELVAKEVGYRRRFGAVMTADLAAFVNRYDNLRSLEPSVPGGIPVVLSNKLVARTEGLEATVEVQAAPRWQVHTGYAFLREKFTPASGSLDPAPGVNEHNDARHKVTVRSFLNVSKRIEIDAVLRAVSKLQAPAVPAYAELTLHLGWSLPDRLEIALIGDNLLHDRHPEFGQLVPREEFRRAVFLQTTWQF
jgi:iron complex outermembrane recepter protein